MEDWVTDFVQRDTTYMVLRGEKKLGGDDLNRVQVKMLASSNVPHVLDLHVREVDDEAELHYNIGGKRMLSTCMKTEKITLVEYYALLLQIVTALEYGMTYMLNPNGFLLKEDYMFVEGPLSEGTVYLTYLPLSKSMELAPSRERIGGLAARWMTAVDDFRGTGVQRILQMCEQSSFSLQSLKGLLIGLLAGSGKRHTGGLEAAGAAAPKLFPSMNDYSDARGGAGGLNGAPASSAWPQGQRAAAAVSQPHAGGAAYGAPESAFSANADGGRLAARNVSPARQPQPYAPQDAPQYAQNFAGQWGSEAHSALPPVEEEEEASGRRKRMGRGGKKEDLQKGLRKGKASDGEDEFGEVQPEDSKNGRLVMPLIGVLLLAVLWKFLYLDNPGKTGLLICVVATPLLIVFAYLGWAGKLKFGGGGRRQEEEEAEALAASWQKPREESGHRVFYGQPGNDAAGTGGRQAGEWGVSREGDEGPSIPGFLRPSSSYSEGFREESPADVSQRMRVEEFERPAAVPGTGMLAAPASQPTVMLDGGRSAAAAGLSVGGASGPRYRLERLENGSLPQSIALLPGSFTIGRSQEVSQHVETAAGISRAHVELELTDNQCTIKDIGSRNGTLLNGEALTPYKAYEMHEGDTFKIAGISYTLRCG
ncbi:DUF6382 domain-containing protein [Saccharibacillus alkalitolerans]|uniref:FHA domain-containing protein n=1 Tax=Saccharibacillus alkalitolerans TaxID=2705290 RepID=A0ABX0F7U6_9BACL|nr:DUF6382 domain-containing protein [Saccharibacillus alkalitolerans]NGZ76005.1 FHA domain-containing protein [Saccharibacillus alkalitolerans]